MAFWYEQESHASELFKEVMNEIEMDLPEVITFQFGESRATKLTLPQTPFFVLTPLIEDDLGNLTPKVMQA